MKERNLIEDIQKTNFINKRTSECREREPRRATTGRWAWLLGMPRGYWECWGGRGHTGAGRGSGGGDVQGRSPGRQKLLESHKWGSLLRGRAGSVFTSGHAPAAQRPFQGVCT